MIYIFILTITGLLGLCIGSFLNVLVDRLPQSEDIILKRSHCDSCGRVLSPMDLVPVLSFILLKGRCRYCQVKLSYYYPLIELTTAVSLMTTVYVKLLVPINSGLIDNPLLFLDFCFWLVIVSALIVIFFTDLKYGIIPDAIVFPVLLIVFIRLIAETFLSGNLIISPIITGVITSFSFALIIILTRGKGMGWGDVKFVGLMGLILGFPKILAALYTSFLTGALAGVILILIRRRKFGQTIAFGPFLVIGTVVALIYGDQLVNRFMMFIY